MKNGQSKTLKLRQLIKSPQLEFIMEAHNGLSAKIVEEAGFKGIWASGLSISASLGVRDNNEASWTQVVDVAEFMSDATTIPILLDGDTGHGNFNNMRRFVRKLESRGVAGVCIEDKLFPKTNSFIGEAQPLADIEEFCGKIKAGLDAKNDDNFVIVARVEAFIAGHGLDEALKRAEAYRQAGADAILIHSKKSGPSDIEDFMRAWENRHPVVIVPTKYFSTPSDFFRNLNVSMAIWANHNVRAAVQSMQEITRQIYKDEGLINIESKVASVSEIFRLQGADELEEAEKKYLPATDKFANAVVLAAGTDTRLRELTEHTPKIMLKVGGKTILQHMLDGFDRVGIKDVSVVAGFGKDKIPGKGIQLIENEQFEKTSNLYSLYLAREKIKDYSIISYGDILYKSYVLNEIFNDDNDITIFVDADVVFGGEQRDYVHLDRPYSKKLFQEPVNFLSMSTSMKPEDVNGEFIGLWRVQKNGAKIVKQTLEELSKDKNFYQMDHCHLFNELAKKCKIKAQYIKGNWLDIDTIFDLQRALEF